jgi:hypothetical protein
VAKKTVKMPKGIGATKAPVTSKVPLGPEPPAGMLPLDPAVDPAAKAFYKRRSDQKEKRLKQIEGLKGKRRNRRIAAGAGVGALALLGGNALKNSIMRSMGATDEQLMQKALADLQAQQQRQELNGLVQQAQTSSYQDSIQRNLQNMQRYAPDLYMSVAAGRRLPTGAVVLGGENRQDLLNELGRAMSDGRFSQ